MNYNMRMTDNGFIRKNFDEVLRDLKELARGEFGDDVNLSETSPLGKFLRVIAWKLVDIGEDFEHSYYMSHLLSSGGIGLDMWGSNFGDSRLMGTKAASKIKIKGDPRVRINKGFAVGRDVEIVYYTMYDVVLDSRGEAVVDVEAASTGSIYNAPIDAINVIINPIMGVFEVNNIEPAIGGTNIETDEEYRERLLFKLRTPLTGDNEAQYRVWIQDVDGVGHVKILKNEPSPGFVTAVISTKEGHPADDKLVNNVYNKVNKHKSVVSGFIVESAVKKDITIDTKVKLNREVNMNIFKKEIEDGLSAAISSMVNDGVLSYARISYVIMNHKDVEDIKELKVNGKETNIEIGPKEAPVLNKLYIEVV